MTTGEPEVIITPQQMEVVPATMGTEPPEAMLWKHFATVARTLLSTDFVPKPYQGNTPAIMACLAYGHELGLGPMQSLQSIDVIQGKPTLKPETMRALIRSAGHSLTRVEASATSVTLHGKRRDTGDEETVTYTIEDARALGLTGKDNWKKQPRAMLTARATSEIGRSLFSDVIMGASYTPEELGDDTPVDSDDMPGAGRRMTAQEYIARDTGDLPFFDDVDDEDLERPFTRQVEELPLGDGAPV